LKRLLTPCLLLWPRLRRVHLLLLLHVLVLRRRRRRRPRRWWRLRQRRLRPSLSRLRRRRRRLVAPPLALALPLARAAPRLLLTCLTPLPSRTMNRWLYSPQSPPLFIDQENVDSVCGSFVSGSTDAVIFHGASQGDAYAVELDPGFVPIPRNHAEAVNGPVYGAKWRAACDNDIKGKYTILKTWELVESISTGRRAIKGKWVFSVKYKPDGSIEKLKMRYVGCGYSQIQGLDYVDSFCSTLPLKSLRCFLCGACLDDDDLLEVDVVKAFPSGDWDGTEIYLQQPPGYAGGGLRGLPSPATFRGHQASWQPVDDWQCQDHRQL